MYKILFLFTFFLGRNMDSAAQTIQDKIAEETKNPKREERATRADAYLKDKTIITENELRAKRGKPFSEEEIRRKKKTGTNQ